MKNFVAIILVVAVTVVYSQYKAKNQNNISTDQLDYNSIILRELPDFDAVSLKSGEIFSREKIKQIKPQVLVVHFWATWCGPCEAEFPSILQLASKLENQKRILFLFIAVRDTQKAVEKFVGKFPQISKNVTILLNTSGDILSAFGTVKVPETYIFNEQLKTQFKLVGPQEWNDSFHLDRIIKMVN